MPVSISGSGPITGLTSIASPTTLNGLTIPTTGFGKVLQVVYATSTTEASNNSTTTYADTNLSATITPSSTSSSVLVVVAQSFRANGTTEANGSIKIVRGSTDIWTPGQNYAVGVGGASGAAVDVRSIWSMLYLDSPSSSSATTYKTQFNRNAGTITVQPNSTRSSIILIEIGP